MVVVVLSHQLQSLNCFHWPVDVQVGYSTQIESFVAFGVKVQILLEKSYGCWKVALVIVSLLGLLKNGVAVG